MYPALVDAGYSKRFSIGLLTTAGTLGPIVPPSIALIIYGSVTGSSVGRLFAAGLLPDMLVSVFLIRYCIGISIMRRYPREGTPSFIVLWEAFKLVRWALALTV